MALADMPHKLETAVAHTSSGENLIDVVHVDNGPGRTGAYGVFKTKRPRELHVL
jgi:hypothetical protein